MDRGTSPEYEQEVTEMQFEVIGIKESLATYRDTVAPAEYYGVLPSLVCEWQYEFTTESGEVEYTEVKFSHGDAEQCAEECYLFDRVYGPLPARCTLTGRVVFRGYDTEHWDFDERDEYFLDATADEIRYARDLREVYEARMPAKAEDLADEYEEYYE